MSADTDERAIQDTERDMADEAARMQEDLEELEEHADTAAKKAQVTREHADEPSGDEEPGTSSS
jgi:hypothetical protein